MTGELSFDDDEIAGMKAVQSGHMMDACKIQARVQTVATDGERVESFPADGEEIGCGLEMQPGSERHTSEGNVIQYDAVIRLPHGTAVVPTDRIKIVKRFGVRLDTPLIYEVLSPFQEGVSGRRYLLRILDV